MTGQPLKSQRRSQRGHLPDAIGLRHRPNDWRRVDRDAAGRFEMALLEHVDDLDTVVVCRRSSSPVRRQTIVEAAWV